jgi:3-oxoacyl-[acyl-carrier-protein] synthase II
MLNKKVAIADYEILSAYGMGVKSNWLKLLNSETAIKENKRFSTKSFLSSFAATIPDLEYSSEKTLILQMLETLKSGRKFCIKNPELLILATTVGEIELLENAVIEEDSQYIQESNTDVLLSKVKKLYNAKKSMLISAACASSSAGIAYASDMIKSGKIENALIIGCDAVTEFIYSGFSALMALDSQAAKPFDKNRSGLTLGEGAACIFLTSDDFAVENNLPVKGYISGYGMSNDANHITGPSRDGNGLARAIKKALSNSALLSSDIGVISAHGTGTVYNDSMEMKAFKSVFENPLPVYSLKGGFGHTMGAAGIIEVIVAAESLKEGIILPTIGLIQPDEEAEGWVYKNRQNDNSKYCISVNAGFGGINSAVIIEKSS